jgi:hypothetical protein
LRGPLRQHALGLVCWLRALLGLAALRVGCVALGVSRFRDSWGSAPDPANLIKDLPTPHAG